MKNFTVREANAAGHLRDLASSLVADYAEPCDREAARLALLMVACQQEAQAQGMVTKVIFDNQEE